MFSKRQIPFLVSPIRRKERGSALCVICVAFRCVHNRHQSDENHDDLYGTRVVYTFWYLTS